MTNEFHEGTYKRDWNLPVNWVGISLAVIPKELTENCSF